VAALQEDPAAFTLQVRLADAFGDNGMISVLICRRRQDDWDIDTWLMSCRVLGRKVEAAVLQELIGQARARGIRRLLGSYRPTEKNRLVEDHYGKLGFTLIERRADGSTLWELPVEDATTTTLPITIRRLGFEPPLAAPVPA
jgi:FkbH-like protein